MPFNVNEISSAINQVGGIAFAPHFYVQITPPKCLQQASSSGGGNSSTISQIPMFCESTQMPGIRYQTFDIAPNGFGIYESRPIMALFDNINLSFYCDAKGNIQKMFQLWVQNIQNFSINQQTSTTINGAAPGVFNYPDWYEAQVQIFQYDPTGQKVINTWTLYNCFPMTINPVPIAWDQENQLLKLSVDLYVKQWSTESTTQGNSPGSDSNSYSQTRVDPGISQAISQAVTTVSGLVSAINNIIPTSFAPLTTDVRTNPIAVAAQTVATIIDRFGNPVTPISSTPTNSGTDYDIGNGLHFVTFT